MPLQNNTADKLKVYDKFPQQFNTEIAKIKSEIFYRNEKITNVTLNM